MGGGGGKTTKSDSSSGMVTAQDEYAPWILKNNKQPGFKKFTVIIEHLYAQL
jgi:hypothetical protein